jgi:hypothetical protein
MYKIEYVTFMQQLKFCVNNIKLFLFSQIIKQNSSYNACYLPQKFPIDISCRYLDKMFLVVSIRTSRANPITVLLNRPRTFILP